MSCMNPYFNEETRTVHKCGHCAGCIDSRSKDWIFRVSQEMRNYENNMFVTLTYNNRNLPSGRNLCKVDLQNFIKRFRDHLSRHYGIKGLRCFYCGEYGDRNGRPHYHLLFFGLDTRTFASVVDSCWRDRRGKSMGWTVCKTSCSAHPSYLVSYVLKCFPELTVRVVGSGRKKSRQKFLKSDGRVAPFIGGSKGIGKCWLSTKDCRTAERVGYCVLDGVKYSIPVYYQRFLDSHKTIYELEVARTERFRFRFEELQKEGFLGHELDFDSFKRLKISVYEKVWKARDARIEQDFVKRKTLLRRKSALILDFLLDWDESRFSNLNTLEDLCHRLYRDRSLFKKLCFFFSYSFMKDFLLGFRSYERDLRNYNTKLSPLYVDIDRDSNFLRYLTVLSVYKDAVALKYFSEFDKRKQKLRNFISKQNLKPKGVL